MNQIINKCFTYLLVFQVILFVSCSDKNTNSTNSEEDFSIAPAGFFPIPFPRDNPYNSAKEKLGRYLFFDKIFSHDLSLACASCHKPQFAFAGNVPNPMGANNISITRNALSLVNVAYRKKLGWDGIEKSLEEIIYGDFESPIFFNNDTNVILKRLEQHSFYPKMFEEAFGQGTKPYPFLAAKALATFVRTLVSGNSPYDKFLRGDSNALTPKQKLGMQIFYSERGNCFKCHNGFLFTDENFHNTGTTTHYFDRGRFHITGKLSDRNKFKTPSLRNIQLTAPYLHDGTYFTLEEIIENYNRGGYPFFNKDTLMKPLNLTKDEQDALISFLKALTDWEFINSRRFNTFGY